MKISYNKKPTKNKEEMKIIKTFRILTLVFTLTLFVAIFSINKLNETMENYKENSTEQVTVFNESNLEKILFYTYEN
ncbi:MAG: hypothetical protein IKA02_06605 [Clostridia bacterium]|nr:hypothetical protein [Clostridia bacterium]